MNVLRNFIHHEAIICDVKDPQQFNKAFKSLIQEKKTFKKYCKNRKKHPVFTAPNISSTKKNSLTNVSEQNYYSRMLTKLNLFKLIKRN